MPTAGRSSEADEWKRRTILLTVVGITALVGPIAGGIVGIVPATINLTLLYGSFGLGALALLGAAVSGMLAVRSGSY